MKTQRFTVTEAEALLVRNKFGVSHKKIYGKRGTGTNGSGAAIDYLVTRHEYTYLPNQQKPRYQG